MKILVTGAGGFLGGHMVKRLVEDGVDVRAVDIKPYREWWQHHGGVENISADLSLREACMSACKGMDRVIHLAAQMGGMKFITDHAVVCGLNGLIDLHMLQAAEAQRVERLFYSSSACVSNIDKQNEVDSPAIKESDAWPAQPNELYGLQKLYTEEVCRAFRDEGRLDTRIARYHNSYGPHGSYNDGREKAPAAICRKVAHAYISNSGVIDIWGDGEQTRSFMTNSDCIEGTLRILDSDYDEPLNLGSSEMVTINQLVDTVEQVASEYHLEDIKLERRYQLDKPQGVRGRNSDNTLIHEVLGWEPTTSLHDGLTRQYVWIFNQLMSGH